MTRREEMINDLPYAIEEVTTMSKPNEAITIYDGSIDFKLDNSDKIFKAQGKIMLLWQPNITVKFFGEYDISEPIDFHDLFQTENIFLLVNSNLFHSAFVTKASSSNRYPEAEFELLPFFGNKKTVIDCVKFSIPNLRRFTGKQVRREREGGFAADGSRIILRNEKFEIILDKRYLFRKLYQNLKTEGGHLLLYDGLIRKKRPKQLIEFADLENEIYCLNFFLSFINGRRVCAMLFKGIFENELIWEDYQYLNTEKYNSSFSWAPFTTTSEQLQTLWEPFCKIWNRKDDRQFLNFAIKWYVEANMNEVSTDTRLIMAQTTLELIYNWWLIDKLQLISVEDSKKLKAENKIRLILAQIGISYDIPEEYEGLNVLKKKVPKVSDGPSTIVFVRNFLVHSNSENMKSIMNLQPETRAEVVMLANWYIELALLKILRYNGKYQKRIVGAVQVPWAINLNS